MLNEILKKHKIDWIERMNISSDEYFVQQNLDKLDDEMVKFEARWGVDVLPRLVGKELREKWEKQVQKLKQAIVENDVMTIGDLVAGTIRGLGALEKEAITLGHTPHDIPVAWSAQMPDGKTLLIVASNSDARKTQSHAKDCVVMTLSEIANLVCEKRKIYDITLGVKKEITTSGPIDWINGDDIPF